MKFQYPSKIAAAVIAFLSIIGLANAQSGENTYKQVCANCHGTGVLNAPKFGDKAKWAPLIAEGQVTLTAHAYFGCVACRRKGAILI
jgi:cytochrome c5